MRPRSPELAESNKFLFEYASLRDVHTNADFAARIEMSESVVYAVRVGRASISPNFLLKTLQAMPPKSWNEFDAVGRAWYPTYERLRREKHVKLSDSIRKYPADKRNMPFFEPFYAQGITIDANIAALLGVSSTYINLLRSGQKKASERLYKRAAGLFSQSSSTAVCFRKYPTLRPL